MTPRESAQAEADQTFNSFIKVSKYTVYVAIAFFLFVASCNFGVEDGPNATGSGYDGSVYNPSNLKVK